MNYQAQGSPCITPRYSQQTIGNQNAKYFWVKDESDIYISSGFLDKILGRYSVVRNGQGIRYDDNEIKQKLWILFLVSVVVFLIWFVIFFIGFSGTIRTCNKVASQMGKIQSEAKVTVQYTTEKLKEIMGTQAYFYAELANNPDDRFAAVLRICRGEKGRERQIEMLDQIEKSIQVTMVMLDGLHSVGITKHKSNLKNILDDVISLKRNVTIGVTEMRDEMIKMAYAYAFMDMQHEYFHANGIDKIAEELETMNTIHKQLKIIKVLWNVINKTESNLVSLQDTQRIIRELKNQVTLDMFPQLVNKIAAQPFGHLPPVISQQMGVMTMNLFFPIPLQMFSNIVSFTQIQYASIQDKIVKIRGSESLTKVDMSIEKYLFEMVSGLGFVYIHFCVLLYFIFTKPKTWCWAHSWINNILHEFIAIFYHRGYTNVSKWLIALNNLPNLFSELGVFSLAVFLFLNTLGLIIRCMMWVGVNTLNVEYPPEKILYAVFLIITNHWVWICLPSAIILLTLIEKEYVSYINLTIFNIVHSVSQSFFGFAFTANFIDNGSNVTLTLVSMLLFGISTPDLFGAL